MRISRYLALAGIGSRRACEQHVLAGKVTVNGEVIGDLGRQVDPGEDDVCYRGRLVSFSPWVYYMLHKPEGYVTSASDPHGAKTVYDLLPSRLVRATARPGAGKVRVFSVGRLDKDSSGLLLFTNDGDFANLFTHPRYQVVKEYEVRLSRAYDPRDTARLLAGIPLSEGLAAFKKVYAVSRRIIRVLLCEGKRREIRRVLGMLDYGVVSLKRISVAGFRLGMLPPGRGRFLSKDEIRHLKEKVHRG